MPEFKKASLTSDIAYFYLDTQKIEVLLIKRKSDPFKGCWAMPGGFVELANDETFMQAAIREFREECGVRLNSKDLAFFTVLDDPKRDPRDRVVSAVFVAHVTSEKSKNKVKAGDDAAELKWFNVDKLPPIAFDHLPVLEKIIANFKPQQYLY